MRLRRESKHSGKVDAQSLQVLALAQLTWGAYNKQSKQVLKIGGFYQDFLRHIRLELLDYYEKVTAGDPTRTDLYKLNHYRRLEKGLVKEIKALGVKEQALGEKLLKDTIKDVYEASSFGQSAPVHLWEAIKSEQWDMSRFSDLVWKQKETLRRALIGDIRYGLASGMPIGDLAQRLQKSTGQSEFNAYRLVRNESMIASHHAKHMAYKDLGVEKVRIVVALDERTCEICSAQAGEVMSLDEALNRLPFHIMCRCTYVAVTKDNELVTKPPEPEEPSEAPKIKPSQTAPPVQPSEEIKTNPVKVQDVHSNIDKAAEAINKDPNLKREELTQFFPKNTYIGDNPFSGKRVMVKDKDWAYIVKTHVTDGSLKVEDLKNISSVLNAEIVATENENSTNYIFIKKHDLRDGYLEGITKSQEQDEDELFHFLYRGPKKMKQRAFKLNEKVTIIKGTFDIFYEK